MPTVPVSNRRRRVLWAVVAAAALLLVGGLGFVGTRATEPGRPEALRDADPVIAAAGDIACDPASRSFNDGAGRRTACRQLGVSDLLLDPAIDHVLALGDLQYHCGSKVAFQESYDRSWGRVKDKTLPVPGNHEYIAENDEPEAGARTGCEASNEGAAGYFDYFGAVAGDPAKGYYSVDVGAWHLVALNSNCSKVGGCEADSPQVQWLRADLAAHPTACTLAFFHHPRFSSGDHGSEPSLAQLWQVLYDGGVEVVLNGHEHIYERFAPQTPQGTTDDQHGIRQFTVGTGGNNHTDVVAVQPNSQVQQDKTFGVLRMTLHPTSYSWQFVPEQGTAFSDTGSAQCHDRPA
jgi:acid phosphatase type 7